MFLSTDHSFTWAMGKKEEMTRPVIGEDAKLKMNRVLESSVDGPTRLVADAIMSNVGKVRTLALDGGLVSNELRRIAWPLLLSERAYIEDEVRLKRDEKNNQETFKQIELDVPRSVNREDRPFLTKFLTDFFMRHVDLCFFQGFADIAWTVLMVMTDGPSDHQGIGAAHYILGRLSRDFFLRDAHRPTFDAIYASLEAIGALITKCDKDLQDLWQDTKLPSHWAISPLVCLFTHDLSNLSAKAKILDAIIASETQPDLPIYLVASLVLLPDVKIELLASDKEPCTLHQVLLDSAKNEKYIDCLVESARHLRERVPPKLVLKVAESAGLPKDSCLRRFEPEASPGTLRKKRSWRTYSFFASLPSPSLELHIF